MGASSKMAIPTWAVEALMRSVGTVVDKVPPERLDQIRQRAGQWLEELPQSAARGVDSVVRSARAGKEMIDRWARRHSALVTPVINATGCLSDARIQGVPMGDGVIDLAAEAMASPPLNTPLAIDRLNRRLNRCAGDSDLTILVANSVDAACLAIGMTRKGRPIFMHRCQSLRLASGTPIPEAFLPLTGNNVSGEHVHEVGSVDGIAAEDAQSPPSHAILLAVDNGEDDPLWFASASGDQTTRIVLMMACNSLRAMGSAADAPSQTSVSPHVRSADCFLSPSGSNAAVDVVITPGDAVLGGPPCGLIIGRKLVIEGIAASPIWRSLRASLATTAMVTHALESIGKSPLTPVQAMLHTGEENLRSRAERLAIRISADESIRTCQVTSEPGLLTPSGPWRLASRQLKLQHQTKTAAAWADQLADGVPAVLAGVADDSLIIDLRWVPPSDDAALAAALIGQTTTETQIVDSFDVEEQTP